MTEPDSPVGPGRGGRTRAGTNMTRARSAILAAAARCLIGSGSRTATMADIAREAGVAKATLYNHFRTKRDVYDALLAAQVDALLAELTALPASAGSAAAVREPLALAAARVSADPVLRAIAAREPELAARLAVPDAGAPWAAARRFALHRVTLAQAAGALHPRHEAASAVELLLRWVASHVLAPAPEPACAAAAGLLVQALVAPPYAVAPVVPVAAPQPRQSITA